jgi:HD-GYP domain-containing protein (c-di-GMP phosphodiesterase class II)
MGWSGKDLENLARGAYLHDIGKLGIPDGILLKPGPLTPDERSLMQQHVQIGFDIVKDIPFLADTAEIILMHHERFDGAGYPRRLKGQEILPGARIFSIADTLDAITSDRPYHRASSFESGRETIRRFSGSQFDPEVVRVFLSIPAGSWEAIAENQRHTASLAPELRRSHGTLRSDLGVLS